MQSQTFYVAVWKAPRVRTHRAAAEAVHRSWEDFTPSPGLLHLMDELAGDTRITVDETLGMPRDRFVLLQFPWVDLAELGPKIAGLCEAWGLTLMDIQHETLVVPTPRGSRRPWPRPEAPRVQRLVNALRSTPLTGDLELDRERLNRAAIGSTGGVPVRELFTLSGNKALPFTVPSSLRFALPAPAPVDRQRAQALKRLIADLASDRPEHRRAAAFDLGGWGDVVVIDDALVRAVEEEPDPYVRSVAAMSLATRGDQNASLIVAAAEDLVADVGDKENRWAVLAGTLGVLAATIVAARTRDAELRGRVKNMAGRLEKGGGQSEWTDALLGLVSEFC